MDYLYIYFFKLINYYIIKLNINNYNNENENSNGEVISEEMKDIFLPYFKLLIKMDKCNYLISAVKKMYIFILWINVYI